MIDKLEVRLNNIIESYMLYANQKDEQSLFYINQMIDLLYNELKYETENDKTLKSVIMNFKDSIDNIYSDLKEYFAKIINNSITDMNKAIMLSTSNRYIDEKNIKNIQDKFKEEINSHLKLIQFHNLVVH